MQRKTRSESADRGGGIGAESPLLGLLAAGSITRIELAARSGVNLRAIKAIADDGDAILRLPLSTLLRIAIALGCAPVELLPMLGRRASRGLLYERGVFQRK